MKHFICTLVFFYSVTVSAKDTVNELALAQLAYAKGNFAYTRTSAQQLGTADGYALACRSGLVIGGFQEKGTAAVRSLHGAIENCQKALELDPTHYSAGISHAIATGFEGLRLRKSDYARTAKKYIENLIQRHPDNALAMGALAGWHAAVSHQGMFARLILGASRDKARTLFAKAVRLRGSELPLYFEYIRFLAAGNNQDKSKAESLLAKIIAKSPKNALEKLLLEKCLNIQSALQSDDKKSLEQALAAATPFAGIDEWGALKKTDIKGFPLLQNRDAP